jgi:hypothetical protein
MMVLKAIRDNPDNLLTQSTDIVLTTAQVDAILTVLKTAYVADTTVFAVGYDGTTFRFFITNEKV